MILKFVAIKFSVSDMSIHEYCYQMTCNLYIFVFYCFKINEWQLIKLQFFQFLLTKNNSLGHENVEDDQPFKLVFGWYGLVYK